MSQPVEIYRGKAIVAGIAGSFDSILYALQQTAKGTQNYEEEIVKDVHGYDCTWVARNEHLLTDFSLKLVADTQAHADAPVAAVTGTNTTVSDLGQPFLSPLSCVSLGGFKPATLNGIYQIVSGNDVDIANTKVGDLNFKLRRYANSTQNGTITASPT